MDRRLRGLALLVFLLPLAGTEAVLASDGYFDSTWAGGGRLLFDGAANLPSPYSKSFANAVTLDAGGNLLLAGSVAADPTYASNFVWLGQLLPNGQFVPSFGAGDGTGRITTCAYSIDLCSNDFYGAIAIQPDGRYLVVTETHDELLRTATKALALESAESNAVTVNDAGGSVAANQALAMQGGTKILAAGYGTYSPVANKHVFGILRLGSNLALDTSFGAMTDAQQTTFAGGALLDVSADDSEENVRNIFLQPDGSIVLAGFGFPTDHATWWVETARFTANGLLDTTYGTNGATRFAWSPGGILGPGKFAMDSAGRVLVAVAGQTSAFHVEGMLVARLDLTGSLDLSFGDAFAGLGFSFNEYNTQCATMSARAVAVDSAGRILVAGQCVTASATSYFAVERLRGDGTLDTTFGIDGFSLGAYANGDDDNFANSIALDGSGRPIVAGGADALADGFTRTGVARLTYDLIYTNDFQAVPRGCLPPDCN